MSHWSHQSVTYSQRYALHTQTDRKKHKLTIDRPKCASATRTKTGLPRNSCWRDTYSWAYFTLSLLWQNSLLLLFMCTWDDRFSPTVSFPSLLDIWLSTCSEETEMSKHDVLTKSSVGFLFDFSLGLLGLSERCTWKGEQQWMNLSSGVLYSREMEVNSISGEKEEKWDWCCRVAAAEEERRRAPLCKNMSLAPTENRQSRAIFWCHSFVLIPEKKQVFNANSKKMIKQA